MQGVNVANRKTYMDNVQNLIVSELSHDNVRNSVCSDWLLEACLEHNDWGGGQPIQIRCSSFLAGFI